MKKITILFFVLFAILNVFAGTNSGNPILTGPNNGTEEKGCNLPAPEHLAVTNVTSNSITVQWDAVAGASSYDVRAYVPGTNIQYPVSVLFGGVTTATVSPLPGATSVEIRVAAACPGNEVSPNFSTVIGLTDVVIELVISGFDCPNVPTYGQLFGVASNISFDVAMGNNAAVYKFKVTKENTNFESYFEMQIIDKARFHMTSGGAFGGNSSMGTFAPYFGAPTVFNFRVSSSGTNAATLKLTPGQQPSGYKIQISQPMCGNGNTGLCDPANGNNELEELPVSEERGSDKMEAGMESTTISPVPFDDYLKIQFEGNGEFSTDANIRLFAVNGAIIESRNVAANTENNTVELNTANLLPGLYVLQVQTAQGSVTKLVTKMAH